MTVCIRCGRVGRRGFVLVSGTMDGDRDSWGCTSRAACDRRQARNPLPEYRSGGGPGTPAALQPVPSTA